MQTSTRTEWKFTGFIWHETPNSVAQLYGLRPAALGPSAVRRGAMCRRIDGIPVNVCH